MINGVNFYWNPSSDLDYSHHLYRVKIEDNAWSDWIENRATSILRILSNEEREEHGVNATIYIDVRAVDVFGQQGTEQSSNADVQGLNIQSTDINDFAIDASKLFVKIPILEGLTLTNNSPTTGYVSWNTHTLYYNGAAYSIAAGNTNNYYIYWKDLAATAYSTSDSHPGDNLSDWNPGEDFIIAVNDDGNGQEAWSAIANQVIGSAYIMNAAIGDLQVDEISGTKIVAQSVSLFGESGGLESWVSPQDIVAPIGSGLYMGADYIGYYAAGEWVTYMDSDANFYLGGTNGALQWNGQTLAITGSINITETSTIEQLLQISSGGTFRTNTTGNYPYIEISNSGMQLKDADDGGTVGTAKVNTDIVGFGATVWLMNRHYFIPWLEAKEPKDGSTNDMPSLRLFDRTSLPTGGTYGNGDLCVYDGDLCIYKNGSWYTCDLTIAS
jgi:hypothetical protein